MKNITVKNEHGENIAAKIMTIDELYTAWETIVPSAPFYTWIKQLIDANIVTQRELSRQDYIVINI